MSVNAKPGMSRHADASKISETTLPCWSFDAAGATSRDKTRSMSGVQVYGITGLPEVERDADLAAMSVQAASAAGTPIESGDVLVVTSKIVSKVEGRTIELADVE